MNLPLPRLRCWRWSPGQDLEPAEGSDRTDGRWRIARKVAEDRVISIVDTEARHTRNHRRTAGTGTGLTWPPSPAAA
jgi:hypothetical protein